MTYDEAMNDATMISAKEAIRECRNHDCQAMVVPDDEHPGGVLYGVSCGDDEREPITTVDTDGMVVASDVMQWLGY